MRLACERVRTLQRLIGQAEESLAIGLVVAMAVVVNLQIFARYMFDAPFIWPEEVSRLLLVWLSFIAAAALMRRGGDIAVDVFTSTMPAGLRRATFVFRDVLMVAVFSVVAFEGFRLAEAVSGMPLVATELPTALLAWPVVIGSGLIAFHSSLRLVSGE